MTSPWTFILETREELKKVIWPSRSDVMRLTVIVIIICLVVGLYIGGLDYAMAKLMEMYIY